MSMRAVYTTRSPEETIELGKKLARRLMGGDTVLLYGELGVGKTHFTKGIAEGLGITMTIKSPTFAIVNQFPIGAPIGAPMGEILYHYDLYRLEKGSDLTSVGYVETIHNSKVINVVEWADRLGDHLPPHYILVTLEGTDEKRTITIEFNRSSILPESEIEAYYSEWFTPLHVRDHCKQVASVAMQIGEAFMRSGEIINANLLHTSCMLHDMCRVCDFKTMDKAKFDEEITDEKWQQWLDCREQNTGVHHADIAHRQLKERGFFETAECIRLHKSIALLKEFNAFDTLEKQITYYADKRVKHTEIVDLKERFRDGRERYGPHGTEDESKLFEDVEKKTHELEVLLFATLDIDPTDIK